MRRCQRAPQASVAPPHFAPTALCTGLSSPPQKHSITNVTGIQSVVRGCSRAYVSAIGSTLVRVPFARLIINSSTGPPDERMRNSENGCRFYLRFLVPGSATATFFWKTLSSVSRRLGPPATCTCSTCVNHHQLSFHHGRYNLESQS